MPVPPADTAGSSPREPSETQHGGDDELPTPGSLAVPSEDIILVRDWIASFEGLRQGVPYGAPSLRDTRRTRGRGSLLCFNV